jgi:DNA repair exonuclease SbcCD ATPase subunit
MFRRGEKPNLTESLSLPISLTKKKAILKELSVIVDRETSGISLGVDSAASLVKHLEGKMKDKVRTDEERLRKIAQLEGDAAELEKRRSEQEEAISRKDSEAEELSSKLQELRETLNQRNNEIKDFTSELLEVESLVSEKKRLAEKLSSDLQEASKRHRFEIESLKKSQEEAVSKSISMESQHKALRLLVREKAITLSELKIMEVLRGQPTTTLEHLQRMTQSRRDEIETTIKSLVRRGVLQFNSTSGEVKVISSLEV